MWDSALDGTFVQSNFPGLNLGTICRENAVL